MMRMLLILTLFLPIFACKKQSASSDTPPAAAAPTSCDAYSPTGNNLNLAGAALIPLPPIDAAQLQVDSLQVTLVPYTSGKDTYNALSFQVVGKSTSNVNLVSDYLQYKVCMAQNGIGGQQCLCNNGTSTCPYQADPAGNVTSALFNEYSTGDYQIPDPYTTTWEVPVPVALSGVLSTTTRLCVRDNRKTSAANCGPWSSPVLRQVSGAYTQAMGQLKQTIQQISTQEGALAFSLVQSAKAYQQAFSSIPYANQNNEERSLALYASNFINFPDSTRQVLQNRDLYTQMLQEVQTTAAGGSSTGLAGGTTGSCAPVAAAIQSITASAVTDPSVSTLTETVVYTYTQNGTLTSTVVQVLPGDTTTITINGTETATIVGPTVTQTDTVTNDVTQVVLSTTPGATVSVIPSALLAAWKSAADDAAASAAVMQTNAGNLLPSDVDQGVTATAKDAAQKAVDDAKVAQAAVLALDPTGDGTAVTTALSQAQSDLYDAATKLAVAQQAITATTTASQIAALETKNAADQKIALDSQVQSIDTKVDTDGKNLADQQTVFNKIATAASYSDADNALAQQSVGDAKAAWTTAQSVLSTAQADVAAAKKSLGTLTDGSVTITAQAVSDADAAERKAAGDVTSATAAVDNAQSTAAVAAVAIASAKASSNLNSQAKKAGVYAAAAATVIIGLVVAVVAGRKVYKAHQYNKKITVTQREEISKYADYKKALNIEQDLSKSQREKLVEVGKAITKAEVGLEHEKFLKSEVGSALNSRRLTIENNLRETGLRIKSLTTGDKHVPKPDVMKKGIGGATGVAVFGGLMVISGILLGVLNALNIGALNLAASSPRDQANLTFLTAMTQLQNRYQALNTALDACNIELYTELAVTGAATLANCRMP